MGLGWRCCCSSSWPRSRGCWPRGSFGGVGLALLLLIKLAALQGVLAQDRYALLLLAAPALARWAVVIAARAYPSARPGGMGDFFRRGLGRRELVIATGIAAAACLPLGWRGPTLWAVAAAAMLALAGLARARLGGLTGDVYGAITELAETAALVVGCLLVGG
ncbi:MAG: adenosylcobinamide-GDP ribazoletransferase [Kiritimatiellaeota bacterium]|nr:adenosylcobinamide-GDP ribazoletransferase [Kiritimatiellota bacterium]